MTIREIAFKACSMLNLQDEASIEQAVEYAKHRWQTIWNGHLWKDSVGYVSVAAEIKDGACFLSVPLERVRNIRCNQFAIYPIDPSNVFQLDPLAFDCFGEITGFSEMGKDEAGNRIVRIFSLPKEPQKYSFLVMGKIKCPELADDDEPFLTGIDDALLEFVTGDLWRRDQQFNKANSSYSNGSTFVEQMRKIDGEQSASNPRIVPDVYCNFEYGKIFDD